MVHRVGLATRLAAAYAVLAALWVVLSDRATARLGDLALVTNVQTAKAMLVVAITASVLFVVATRRDHLSAENRRLRGQLGDLERGLAHAMGSRRSFLEALSHELRAPLTVIHGISATLDERFEQLTPEQLAKFHEALLRNTRRISAAVVSLVELEEMTEGTVASAREPADIATLLDTAVARIDTSTHRVEVRSPQITAWVVASHIQLLVEQLVRNVVRHTPPGTQAWVSASEQPAGVRITVTDNGPGIPLEVAAKVFEPLQQGDIPTHSPGLGIGLALAARIAHLHGGRISLESPSETEGGARFVVDLPQRDRIAGTLTQRADQTERQP